MQYKYTIIKKIIFNSRLIIIRNICTREITMQK